MSKKASKEPAKDGSIRTAIYVRTATMPSSKFQMADQEQTLRRYAARHNMEVVAVYADEGKSGLTFQDRDALKQQLADIRSGSTWFSAILLRDITRWGRFQDPDESACCEIICRNAGIDVVYADEQPQDRPSLVSGILRSLKRAVLRENRRELSAKAKARAKK